MPEIDVPASFKERFQKKETRFQSSILETIQRLEENPRHPSLRTKPVRGTKDPKVFEASIDMKNRMTWHWEDGAIVLRNHCNHDILTRNP